MPRAIKTSDCRHLPQVPLRHAIRIGLGRRIRERETLIHTLLWGGWTALLFGLLTPPPFRLAVVVACISIALGIGYLSCIFWYWRVLPRASFLTVVAVNGLLGFLFGYALFFFSIVLYVRIIVHPGERDMQYLIHSVAYNSFMGFIFPITGYSITAGDVQGSRVRRAERKQKVLQQLAEDARQVALRAQINPHFFFNALNTIAALIPQRPADAERAVELLATALRPVLTREQPLLGTLESELRIATAYAEIERLRLGPRVEIQFRADAGLEGTALPSLSLQPLLENAIVHGAGREVGEYRIAVEARRENGRVVVEIRNALATLFDVLDAETLPPFVAPQGHALQNIDARLRALFGTEARLEARGRAGEAGLVRFRVPVERPR